MRAAWMAAVLASAGCGPSQPDPEARLLEIAGAYADYRLASRSAHWAPERCASVSLYVGAPEGRISTSTDVGTHGRKLYYLHVKDESAYMRGGNQPVGQVLVKEAWTPVEVPESAAVKLKAESYTQFWAARRGELSPGEWKGAPAQRGGKHFVPGERAELFVMYKSDPKTPATDAGWIYGTLTADGKTVLSSGRIESCMACHREAKTDRVFGLPAD